MDAAPFHTRRCRQAVDGVAEDVEHSRNDLFADRHLQWPAGILHGHAASEALRGIERDSADMMSVELHQHLNGDLRLIPRAEQGIDRRQAVIETHIHDAAAHRRDYAVIRVLTALTRHHMTNGSFRVLTSGFRPEQVRQIVTEQVTNAIDRDVRRRLRRQGLGVGRVMPLSRKNGRQARPPHLLHGGQEAKIVVLQDIVTSRIVLLDVGEFLFLVDVN